MYIQHIYYAFNNTIELSKVYKNIETCNITRNFTVAISMHDIHVKIPKLIFGQLYLNLLHLQQNWKFNYAAKIEI